MVKKYLIRIVGSLCILAAIALMLMPSWVEIDDVERRDLRNLSSDVRGVCASAVDSFSTLITDDDFKEELKNYDLPYTRGKIKSRFQEIENLTVELLNDTVSLQEILTLSVKAPGLVQDAENLLISDCSNTFFRSAAGYILYQGSQAIDEKYDSKAVTYAADQLRETAEDSIDMISEFSFVFPLLAGVLIFILVLGVASAITHICNKCRWLKYLFLVIMVGMVAGSFVTLPLVSDMLAEVLYDMPPLADMTLQMTVTPFIAVVLMIVPIVLDIVFERKKKTILVEE